MTTLLEADLYPAMIKHISQGRLPRRENHINPRVVKKKMSNFGKKMAEHYHLLRNRKHRSNNQLLSLKVNRIGV
ncbi:MAG: hypothetical protein KAV82_01500 [Phycisphaerae bacterium]|nr:hypothetical protein [Phycisphaerae bacterium]